MILTEEEEEEQKKEKNAKITKIIIATIVLLVLLGIVVGVILIYKLSNPTTITTTINGVAVSGLSDIVDVQTDAYGETVLYFKIRDFAEYINAASGETVYTTFNGNYSPKTEDNNMCYIVRDKYEVAIFTADTKTIYKLNLQSGNDDYNEYNIDSNVFLNEEDATLYASEEGIEQGYNVTISYNDAKKTITIYTIDYLISSYETTLSTASYGNYGTLSVYDDNFDSCKSIFDDLLVVQSSTTKLYGILSTDDLSTFILEPQYDSITFLSDSSTFVVESDGLYGLFSEDGKRKIDMIYDNITSMGEDSGLYVVETNGLYGVVDEEGNIIIYPEYDAVGISVSSYAYNGVKNGYILLDSLIPVQLDKMWALYDKSGKMITDGFIYNEIGCSSVQSGNNIYPLLVIEECNAIVVQDENELYCCIDTNGETLLTAGFIFEQMYLKVTTGEVSYRMVFNGGDYDIVNTLNYNAENSDKIETEGNETE